MSVLFFGAGESDPADLCLLDDVRELLQKKGADGAQDGLTQSLITAASLACSGWAEREFAPASTGLTRVFEWPWDGELVSLAPYDLRVLTSVQADTDVPGSANLLSTDEYRLWPRPARDGTYLSLRVRPFGVALGRTVWRNRQLSVTGDWGFASVPQDVALACAQTCVHWLTVNSAAFRHADDMGTEFTPPRRGIPGEAMQLLSRYKRVPPT